ncbi:MAG: flagellin [Spirochaetia bacterium]|nr:flagellin [Spirochaetia bacterium]
MTILPTAENTSAAYNPVEKFRLMRGESPEKSPENKINILEDADYYKIKKDTADLSITVKMQVRLNGLLQAKKNIANGKKFINITDSNVSTIQNILQKIRNLAVKSANGVYTSNDRQIFQVEVSQMIDEIDRIASQANFNKMNLLQGHFSRGSRTSSMWIHVGPGLHERERIFIATMTGISLNLRRFDNTIMTISTFESANYSIGNIDSALDMVLKQRGDLKAYLKRLDEAEKNSEKEINELLKDGIFEKEKIHTYKKPK